MIAERQHKMLETKLFYLFKILNKSPVSVIILVYKYFQKYYIKLLSNFKKPQYECNICNSSSYMFISDNWHKNIICPNCFSEIRHRLFFSAIKEDKIKLNFKNSLNSTIYHFAPENYLIKFFKSLSSQYLTVDLHRKGYDLNLDISKMSTVKDNSIDFIIAIDVLEHVENFRECLIEIKRVLKNDGEAIISVPQIDNLTKTIFFDLNHDHKHRKEKYGQVDHSNLFGNDLLNIFQNSGFKVNVVESNSFNENDIKKYVLKPKNKSLKKFATNNRKIYSLTM